MCSSLFTARFLQLYSPRKYPYYNMFGKRCWFEKEMLANLLCFEGIHGMRVWAIRREVHSATQPLSHSRILSG